MKVNRPKIYDEFKSYLNNLINDVNLFDIENFILHFNSYLDFINSLFLENFKKRKEYSDIHIAEQIFCEKISDYKTYIKYSLLAQSKSFKRIKKNIIYFCDKKQFDNLLNEVRLMSELVTDSIDFINSSGLKYKDESINFGVFKSNTVCSSQIYGASIYLFRENINFKSWSISAIRYTSIFLIRQSIELRLKNALGILNILDSEQHPIKIKSDFFVNFIKENISYFEFPIEFSILNKIFKWTNLYIHTGIFNYIWLIDWAHLLLNPLFKPYRDVNSINDVLQGRFKEKGNITVFNIFGSIKIKKDFFNNLMIPKLREVILKNNKSYSEDDIFVITQSKPEVMLVD